MLISNMFAKKGTFDEMAVVLLEAHIEKHRLGGKHPRLSNEDKLFLTLKYMCQYVTQKELAFEFDVDEATGAF